MESKKRKSWKNIAIVIMAVLLAASIALNVWNYFWGFDSYLQGTDEIYRMEAGILRNNMEFMAGENLEIQYDFDHKDYPELIAAYGIDRIAGEGSEFEKALRLMNEYAPRLKHKSDYDNHVEMLSGSFNVQTGNVLEQMHLRNVSSEMFKSKYLDRLVDGFAYEASYNPRTLFINISKKGKVESQVKSLK